MKIFNKIPFGKVGVLLTAIILFCGCIDDTYNCTRPTGTFLRFTYTLNTKYRDLFAEQVSDIALFFYTQQGKHILTKDVSCNELDTDNRLYMELTPGNYRVAVWGNLDERHYGWRDPRHPTNFQLDLLCGEGGEVGHEFASLFHGIIDFEILEGVVEEHTVELIKNTNTIHVIMEQETAETRNADCYALITGYNGSYNLENNCVAESLPLQYNPRYTSLINGTQANFTVMRLFQDDDLNLTLGWDGTEGSTVSKHLVSELMKHPEINTNEDLDRWDEYTLTYTKNSFGAVVLIKINNWDVILEPGGI
ncbi:FimB/Mfa2 family fimbrial subunit [Bacteroides sp. 519]|uniref:FimB/Mfa2 family fimbrial subunit n=1 Tax=Bacteroides sp. 519 TaxID=2302937 RepID=UPI0013D778E3|nr:FimB/Mfa2 family fimbrial subunit [Bacteroides sp. 519]NDV60438.1 hypothetical protein [Bacteroides sp. 519]